jgi:hypothetical protein
MKYLSSIISILLIFSSCATKPEPAAGEAASPGITIKHMHWLAGTWKSVNKNEISYEIWEKENDTLMRGRSFVMVDKDTVFSERLQIVQRGRDLFYIPSVRDQNKGQAVPFKFMEFNKGEFNFVNKDHDFPQRIIYKNPQPDFLCARIEGTQGGKFQKINFNFLKIKN